MHPHRHHALVLPGELIRLLGQRRRGERRAGVASEPRFEGVLIGRAAAGGARYRDERLDGLGEHPHGVQRLLLRELHRPVTQVFAHPSKGPEDRAVDLFDEGRIAVAAVEDRRREELGDRGAEAPLRRERLRLAIGRAQRQGEGVVAQGAEDIESQPLAVALHLTHRPVAFVPTPEHLRRGGAGPWCRTRRVAGHVAEYHPVPIAARSRSRRAAGWAGPGRRPARARPVARPTRRADRRR